MSMLLQRPTAPIKYTSQPIAPLRIDAHHLYRIVEQYHADLTRLWEHRGDTSGIAEQEADHSLEELVTLFNALVDRTIEFANIHLPPRSTHTRWLRQIRVPVVGPKSPSRSTDVSTLLTRSGQLKAFLESHLKPHDPPAPAGWWPMLFLGGSVILLSWIAVFFFKLLTH
ncbi:MAG: hypothetical protein HJJLKODD_00744 [Phycisphaerae bacterium]|nr:hypothetical protein [Phycisphaerae bacterium]